MRKHNEIIRKGTREYTLNLVITLLSASTCTNKYLYSLSELGSLTNVYLDTEIASCKAGSAWEQWYPSQKVFVLSTSCVGAGEMVGFMPPECRYYSQVIKRQSYFLNQLHEILKMSFVLL